MALEARRPMPFFVALHHQVHPGRREQRVEARKKVCEVCGEEFIASRRDAKTCSEKCKQIAYRQRKKEAQHNQ